MLFIIDNNNKILIDWYIKPTSSQIYLNYKSYNPYKIKINLVLALKSFTLFI